MHTKAPITRRKVSYVKVVLASAQPSLVAAA